MIAFSILYEHPINCDWLIQHSWHGFAEKGSRWNIVQLWKLFSYITIRIFKISFRNCVSSLISMHYKTFLLQAHLIWLKPRAFNPAQKSISSFQFTENGWRWNIAQLKKTMSYISGRILKISFWNCVSSLRSVHT